MTIDEAISIYSQEVSFQKLWTEVVLRGEIKCATGLHIAGSQRPTDDEYTQARAIMAAEFYKLHKKQIPAHCVG